MLKQPRSVTPIIGLTILESDQRQSSLYKPRLAKQEMPSPSYFMWIRIFYFSNVKTETAKTTKKLLTLLVNAKTIYEHQLSKQEAPSPFLFRINS